MTIQTLVKYILPKTPNQYNYNLIFSKKEELNKLKEKLKSLNEVEDVDVRYGG